MVIVGIAISKLNPNAFPPQTIGYEILFLKIVLFFNTGLALYIVQRYFRHYRIIEDVPTSKIHSCAQGYAELFGIQQPLPKKKLLAYLSQQPCTWYRYKIEELRGVGKNKSWVEIDSGSSDAPILLNDFTGKCFLIVKKVEIITENIRTWYGSNINSTLPITGYSKIFSYFFGKYRFTEELLLIGSYTYVIGMFSTQNNVNYISAQGLPTRRPYIISTLPQTKIITKYKTKIIVYTIAFLISTLATFNVRDILTFYWQQAYNLYTTNLSIF